MESRSEGEVFGVLHARLVEIIGNAACSTTSTSRRPTQRRSRGFGLSDQISSIGGARDPTSSRITAAEASR
jgi:hypothetical protein